jgi:hypothetical protein
VNIMTDWKESKRVLAEARRVERDAAELLQRVGIPDPMTAWRNDADARAEAVRQADRERRREERRDRRERDRAAAEVDVDARIAAAIMCERKFMLEAVGAAMGEFVRKQLTAIDVKLADLERLLQRLREISAAEREQPIDLPRVPLRSVRNIN